MVGGGASSAAALITHRNPPATRFAGRPTPRTISPSHLIRTWLTDSMGAAAENAPSGIVTFVFTDIEGSTRLFRRLGPRYVELLERHNELVRSTCAGHGGYVISIEGDSFFVAFGDADEAIRACAAVQRLIAAEPWPEGAQVRIRIGVHSGLASPRGDGYVSLAVHQAARVMAAAHGGQTLVSQETVDRAGPPDALELRLLGRFRLRDFDEPARLYQLAGEALAESFPAIRAMPADGHNIVLEPTSTIGRDETHRLGGRGDRARQTRHALRPRGRREDQSGQRDRRPDCARMGRRRLVRRSCRRDRVRIGCRRSRRCRRCPGTTGRRAVGRCRRAPARSAGGHRSRQL